MKQTLWIVGSLALLLWGLGSSRAAGVVLYDGALNTTPNAQGWLYLTDPLIGASATQSAAGGATTLDSTPAMSESAGYFNTLHPLSPVLDRSTGFNISFDVRVDSESHVSNDRAGFSIIALSKDSIGVEIGFWDNEIWAQDDAPVLFTHGESVARDTTAVSTRYDLTILGADYRLSADGAEILTGPLRDYSAFGPPYTLSSFIFLGDDTSSAAARVELAGVEVTTNIVGVPEPSSGWLLLLGALLIRPLRRGRGAARIPGGRAPRWRPDRF